MASPKLKDREKKINEIRRLNGFSSIKAETYNKMSFRDKINIKSINEFGFEFFNDTIELPDGQSTNDIAILERKYNSTKAFFGISFDENKSLLHDISCIDYEIGKTIYDYEIKSEKKDFDEFESDILEQLEEIEKIPYIKNVYAAEKYLKGMNQDEHNYTGCYIDIEQKYKDWEEYCIFIDNIKDFISMFIPNFNKLHGEKKNELIEKLSQNYITEDIAKYILDYDLNTHVKAKIDKLTALQLPNLTEPKIIAKFVKLYIKQKSIK